MPQFVNTQGISHYLNEILDKSSEKIIIVSPFVRMNEMLINRLKYLDRNRKLIYFIVQTGKIREFDMKVLSELTNIRLYENKNLHAKCYMNEKIAIISSMNLYEYSQQNNIEYGVLLEKSEDETAFKQLAEEINRTIIGSTPLKLNKTNKQNQYSSGFNINIVQTRLKMLKAWRVQRAQYTKYAPNALLNDEIMNQIAYRQKMTRKDLQILIKDFPIDYFQQDQLMDIFYFKNNYRVAKVRGINNPVGEVTYDSVEVMYLDNNEVDILMTKLELPVDGSIIAISPSNNGWLNNYYDIS